MTQINTGTGWMIPPKTRLDNDAAFNQLIDKMDLEEARRMMCPQSNGNPEKCVKCEGFRTCRPGQRVIRLIDDRAREIAEKTAPVNNAEREERPAANPTSAEREELKKACESGNAWLYIMETRGLSKDAAGEVLSRMIRKFPGIAADYGGSRRIMQRPKAVTITSIAADAQNVQEQAPSLPAEEEHAKEEQSAEKAPECGGMSAAEISRQKGRDRCKNALVNGDPVGFLVDNGLSEHSARERVRRWQQMYPDLFETTGIIVHPRKPGRPRKAAEPEPKQAEDEISLGDFLAEMGVNDEPEARPETALEREQGPSEVKTDDTTGALEAKKEAFRLEKEALRTEIEKLEERIRWIEGQENALEKVLLMFR